MKEEGNASEAHSTDGLSAFVEANDNNNPSQDLVVSVLSSGPLPGASSKQGFKTDKVTKVDEEQRQHPDDQPHHHLDRQHRPGLRLAETSRAEFLGHFSVEFKKGDNHMLAVTVGRLNARVDVNLSLLPRAVNVKPGGLGALASAPGPPAITLTAFYSRQPEVHMVGTGRDPYSED